MILAILDTETTDAPTVQEAEVCEIAWLFYDTTTSKILDLCSFLIQTTRPNSCERINGVPSGVAKRTREGVLHAFRKQFEQWGAIFVVAHYADFDRGHLHELHDLEWFDTQYLEFPKATGAMKLTELCLAHGVTVTTAHRAWADIMLLAELFRVVQDTRFRHDPTLYFDLHTEIRSVNLYGTRWVSAKSQWGDFEGQARLRDAKFRWFKNDKVMARCTSVRQEEALEADGLKLTKLPKEPT